MVSSFFKAASATFPIYLIHYPALYFFSAISQSLVGHRIGLLISAASLVTGLALTPATNKILTLLRSLFGSFGKRFQLGSTLP